MSWGVNPYALHLLYFSAKRSKRLLGCFLTSLTYNRSLSTFLMDFLSSRSVFLFAAGKTILNVLIIFMYYIIFCFRLVTSYALFFHYLTILGCLLSFPDFCSHLYNLPLQRWTWQFLVNTVSGWLTLDSCFVWLLYWKANILHRE